MKRLGMIVLGFLLLFSSCGEKTKTKEENDSKLNGDVSERLEVVDQPELEPTQYIEWMRNPDNGFRNEKVVEDLTFTVQCKTPEYVISVEQKGEALQDSVYKRKLVELEGMEYYDLKISMNEGTGELLKYKLNDVQQYNDRVNYFAFGMQKDISLVDGKDTIPCDLYHFERGYDVSPSAVLLLGFNTNKKNNNDKTIILYDRAFNKGTLKFLFKKDDLNNKPKLRTL